MIIPLKGQKRLKLGKVSSVKKPKTRDLTLTQFVRAAEKEEFELKISLPYMQYLYDPELDTSFSMVYKDYLKPDYRASLAQAIQERNKIILNQLKKQRRKR